MSNDYIKRAGTGGSRMVYDTGLKDPDNDPVYGDFDTVYTPNGVKSLSVSFTRPADTNAYAQYDLVGPSTTAGAAVVTLAGAVRAPGETFRVDKAALRCSDPLLKGKQIRVHVWRTAPALGVGDNGAFNAADGGTFAVADIAGHVGSFDITLDRAGTAGAKGSAGPLDGLPVYIEPSVAGTVDAFLTFEVRTAGGFTPVSGATFVTTLYGIWS
jgi:hypothetical protein